MKALGRFICGFIFMAVALYVFVAVAHGDPNPAAWSPVARVLAAVFAFFASSVLGMLAAEED